MNLKEKLRNYDLESLEETPVVEVTKEELELASEARLESIATEKEVDDAVEVLEAVSETVLDLQDEIEEALEVIDELSPVEVGKVLGSIEAKAEKILDEAEMPKIDQEAWNTDYRVATRVDLEGISDAIKKKVSSFTDMFKSTETLMVKAANEAKTKWVTGNESRIQDSLNSLKDATDNPEAADKIKVGEKLATVRALKLAPKDLEGFAKGLGVIDPSSSGNSTVDKAGLDYVKTVEKVDNGIKLIVSRVDGSKLSYVVAGKEEDTGIEMFTGYENGKLSSKSMSSDAVKNTSETSLEYAKQLLNSAKVINGSLSTISNNAVEEMNALKAMLSGDIEDAKWRSSSIMKNGGWTALGLLAVIGGGYVTGYKIGQYIKPTLKAIKSNASKLANTTVGKKTMELAGKATSTNIGAKALNTAKAGIDKVGGADVAILGTTLGAAGAAIGTTGGLISNALSKKSYEELNAEERLRVLRARIELTTKYSKDAIHGLNSLVNEMVDVANTIIRAHGSKKPEDNAE